MKNKYNLLHKYIFDKTVKEYTKETVNGLFRSILEPVISNQKFESVILFRLLDSSEIGSTLKRLSFSGAQIYSFSDTLKEFGFDNSQKDDIWGQTQFLVLIGQRYSAALIWDYSLSDNQNTDVCLLYNSHTIIDIAKDILNNSLEDFGNLLAKYNPDRRENTILNRSIAAIAKLLDDKNEELLFNEAEKKHFVVADDVLETAAIVAQKAKFTAHEVKNNLSVINLYSKIAEKRIQSLNLNEEEKEHLDKAFKCINNASQNISDLINDLRCLDEPYISEVNIKNLIINTALQCEEKAKAGSVKIIVDNIDEAVFSTDKTKVSCVLMNVIYNAVEACNQGGKITISAEKSDNTYSIFIKNNGEMIPEENQTKIFNQNFTTKETGTGLGLAICKKQLKLISSDIVLVHSSKNETLFEIKLAVN